MNALSIVALLLLASPQVAEQKPGSETVLGPQNPELHEGAELIKAGNVSQDPEMVRRGIELTKAGLRYARGDRDENAGLSNLCAAFIIIRELDRAIGYCDLAIQRDPNNWHAYSNRALAYIFKKDFAAAERDLNRGLEIQPNSRILEKVRLLYLNETDPVEPQVVIDDRGSIDVQQLPE